MMRVSFMRTSKEYLSSLFSTAQVDSKYYWMQENILVDDHRRACITDFGMSTVRNDTPLNVTATIFGGGTPRYVSPELQGEEDHPSFQSDAWAFGMVCYEV